MWLEAQNRPLSCKVPCNNLWGCHTLVLLYRVNKKFTLNTVTCSYPKASCLNSDVNSKIFLLKYSKHRRDTRIIHYKSQKWSQHYGHKGNSEQWHQEKSLCGTSILLKNDTWPTELLLLRSSLKKSTLWMARNPSSQYQWHYLRKALL